MRVPFSIKHQPPDPNVATSRYRHGALLCVHQVERAPLRLSSIQAAPGPGARSSGPLFPTRPPQSARSYLLVSAGSVHLRFSLHRQICSPAIPPAWLMVPRLRPHLHLPPARVMAFHFHLRPATAMAPRLHLPPGSVILQLVVLPGMVKAGFPRPAMETVSRWVVAV